MLLCIRGQRSRSNEKCRQVTLRMLNSQQPYGLGTPDLAHILSRRNAVTAIVYIYTCYYAFEVKGQGQMKRAGKRTLGLLISQQPLAQGTPDLVRQLSWSSAVTSIQIYTCCSASKVKFRSRSNEKCRQATRNANFSAATCARSPDLVQFILSWSRFFCFLPVRCQLREDHPML